MNNQCYRGVRLYEFNLTLDLPFDTAMTQVR